MNPNDSLNMEGTSECKNKFSVHALFSFFHFTDIKAHYLQDCNKAIIAK